MIDGTTQPLFTGTPIIELSGANVAGAIGLLVGHAPNAPFIPTITIRGLVINRFDIEEIRINEGSGHLIEGNFIGTDITGTVALSTNNRAGLTLIGVSNTQVGGTTTAARNLISGNGLAGIQIFDAIGDPVTGLVIEGNLIGTDINGDPTVGNNFLGIGATSACATCAGIFDVTIGGTAPETANLIAGNRSSGIGIATNSPPTQGIQILGNSIFSNTRLGIDLRNNGAVEPNDPSDTDTGPNNLQNYPVDIIGFNQS